MAMRSPLMRGAKYRLNPAITTRAMTKAKSPIGKNYTPPAFDESLSARPTHQRVHQRVRQPLLIPVRRPAALVDKHPVDVAARVHPENAPGFVWPETAALLGMGE